MGCIKSHLKTWGEIIGVLLLICFMLPTDSWAAFASQFSLGVGEEYNDNIFFSKKKDHDFVSTLLPTLSFFYAPAGQIEPTATVSIAPMGELYARHSELNNFGKNFVVQGAYAYRYSPQLSFDFADNFQRQGPTRTGGFGQPLHLQTGPTTPGSGLTNSQDLKDFISQGDQITNSFGVKGSYLYKPDVSFTGFYQNSVTQLLDEGGRRSFILLVPAGSTTGGAITICMLAILYRSTSLEVEMMTGSYIISTLATIISLITICN